MTDAGTDTLDPLLSLAEFEALPEEDEYRLELVRGRVVREPRPGAAHGVIVGELFWKLASHVRGRGSGLVVVETGFRLSVEPPTVRGPDVAFVAAENLPAEGLPIGFWTRAPDLAIEVVSPSNTAAGIREKVLEYLSAGTRLVWVVDPATRSVAAYRSRHEIRLLTTADVLDGNDVLPGFHLPLTELFQPLDPTRG